MPEIYNARLKARLTLDEAGHVRGINHVDEFWPSDEKTARQAAITYMRQVADILALQPEQLEFAHQPVSFLDPNGRGTEYRLSEEKPFFDATTEGFYQTHRNIPVWAAGVTITIKQTPMRVVSAVNTSLDDLKVKLPSEEVVERWRRIFRQANTERAEGLRLDEGRSATESLVANLLAGRAFQRPRRLTASERKRVRGARIISGRFFIYRYVPDERLPRQEKPLQSVPESPSLTYSDELQQWPETEPTLELSPVDPRLRAGADYLVAEVIFTYTTPKWGDINWRALVEVGTNSILYLRALAAAVNGLVFVHDPISESGNATNSPNQTNAVLNTFRDDVVLANLNAPSGGVQSLVGSRVTLSEWETPTVVAPTQPIGIDFDYDVRTNNFSAVNAYYHVDRFFALVEDLGFPLSTYFDGTTFPVLVDHRGLGNSINAHCVGTGSGIDHLCYALADTGDTTNPIGIATDWRVHLHELGGHGILHDHVGGPNFGFCHSAGDSMAIILTDPESQAPDRFLLLPFLPAVVRRHDRQVATWAWGGPNDIGGYSSEQILATTLFRIYRSIGGDAADVNRRRFAARYMVYLILRTVGGLTPATNPANALAFANVMIATDLLNWTTEGVFGGAYGKVIRWSFEKQGLFQPGSPAPSSVTTEGQPPAVDVYIDDGRAGEYEYQAVHWNTTTIWNRHAADGGTTHQEPIIGTTNYAYVKVKNRGTQTANNLIVRGYHTKPMAGLLWPSDFEAFDTPQIAVGTLGANNSEEKVVGPFSWKPNINAYGHDCMLMIASATNDPSNIDNFTAGEVIPEWRLVPNDNNVGQRNVQPVPGGGGSGGLLAGLHGFPLWVGNPNPARAVIDIRVSLPKFLADRGWELSIEGLPSNRFTLDSRKQRALKLDLKPGASFERTDVEATEERDIVITVLADGGVIGGMSYRLDSTIERPQNPLSGSPSGTGDERCNLHAVKLLECLDFHGQKVAKVRVKRVTIDVGLEEECE